MWVCACVVGKRGARRALLWEQGWIGEPCGNGEAGDGEDSGLGGWAVRVCACVTGRSADWAACGRLCGMMRPLADMAQKSP